MDVLLGVLLDWRHWWKTAEQHCTSGKEMLLGLHYWYLLLAVSTMRSFYILASPLYSRSQTLMLTYAILMLHLVVLNRGLCPAGSVWLVLLCKNQRFLLCAVFVQRKTIFMTMFIPRVGTSLVSVANTLSPVLEQWWVHVHLLFLWKPINKERGVK